jgi:hypothetical protein
MGTSDCNCLLISYVCDNKFMYTTIGVSVNPRLNPLLWLR